MSENARLTEGRLEAVEPLGEIAQLLALRLTRLLSRKSSEFSRQPGESSLPFSDGKSGGRPIPENGEEP